MSSEFPNELWTEVFGGVSQTDLVQVATASRAFCALARPLLFAHFNFHPYAVARSPSGVRFLPREETLKSATERLNFWLSPEIASLVHACVIEPWPFSFIVNEEWLGIDGEAGCILLDAFFDKMERFTRMQRLRVLDVDFPPLTPTKLAAITSLRDLAVLWEYPNDTRPEFTVSTAMPLTSFTYISSADPTRDPSPYLPLLDPAYLRQLTVMCNSNVAPMLSTFPSVNKLKVFLDYDQSTGGSSDLVGLLSKVPNAEWVLLNLGLRFRWRQSEVASPTGHRTFPSVKNISIPVKILPAMLSLCPSVVLLNLRRCDVVSLLLALESLQTCPTIRVLFLDITGVKDETHYDFSRVLVPFPRLTSLSWSIHLRIFTPQSNSTAARQLFAALTPALPQTLKELTLCFSCIVLHDHRLSSDESDPDSIRDAILARCSQLQSMILHAEDWFFSWKQRPVAESKEKFFHRVYGPGANELGAWAERTDSE
ncbi:hypothetical protein C8F01DRAFT_1260834 [Mycena amicta]|nr:hypothetical protein C8F01DRAFT_1260834 [Mycena amicta]